jgi:hypothetical protein
VPSADIARGPRSQLSRIPVELADGATTTLHVASYDRREVTPRVVAFDAPTPLVHWSTEQGVRDAVVGGFFFRAEAVPIGEVRIAGVCRPTVPFTSPWDGVRACVQIAGTELRITSRERLGPEPTGDLLQAGPLLVADGRAVWVDGGEDREGFSAGASQFDSDITAGRYPRAALAIAGDRMLAVACDGRAPGDAGMTLGELAVALTALDATDALNLDGGGSASLVQDGRLRNHPREVAGAELPDGRPIMTAITFDPR